MLVMFDSTRWPRSQPSVSDGRYMPVPVSNRMDVERSLFAKKFKKKNYLVDDFLTFCKKFTKAMQRKK